MTTISVNILWIKRREKTQDIDWDIESQSSWKRNSGILNSTWCRNHKSRVMYIELSKISLDKICPQGLKLLQLILCLGEYAVVLKKSLKWEVPGAPSSNCYYRWNLWIMTVYWRNQGTNDQSDFGQVIPIHVYNYHTRVSVLLSVDNIS